MYTLNYEDLSNKVYKSLKGMILKGELPSGQKLVQEDLADRLGVSRTPLLAAFSKLEKELLVEIIPRRGAFVRKYSQAELIDIYDIRLRLEPLGAFEAAERASEEDLAGFAGALASFKAALVSGDYGRIKESDYDIHMELMRISGNRLLYSILSSFNIIVIGNMKGLLKDPSVSHAEHEELFSALKKHDAEGAERIMYSHIFTSRQMLMKSLESRESGIAR